MNAFIVKNLENKILIDPALDNYEELFIVSGYSSATFLNKHLKNIQDHNKKIQINLIIGMPGKRSDHLGFLNIERFFPGQFNGFYLDHTKHTQCHSKLYAWFGKDKSIGFSGSANYSQNGFDSDKQINQMILDNGNEIKKFFLDLKKYSIPMQDYKFDAAQEYDLEVSFGDVSPGGINFIDRNTVQISFLDKNGALPKKSGLNWGQREGRDKNQAYLPIRSSARDEGFLPELGRTFTLITDDNKSFDCVVAQQGRKAIHTTHDNSLLGGYIRERLGLRPGDFVSKDNLINYGRTDYLLRILDDETIYFDFSS